MLRRSWPKNLVSGHSYRLRTFESATFYSQIFKISPIWRPMKIRALDFFVKNSGFHICTHYFSSKIVTNYPHHITFDIIWSVWNHDLPTCRFPQYRVFEHKIKSCVLQIWDLLIFWLSGRLESSCNCNSSGMRTWESILGACKSVLVRKNYQNLPNEKLQDFILELTDLYFDSQIAQKVLTSDSRGTWAW